MSSVKEEYVLAWQKEMVLRSSLGLTTLHFSIILFCLSVAQNENRIFQLRKKKIQITKQFSLFCLLGVISVPQNGIWRFRLYEIEAYVSNFDELPFLNQLVVTVYLCETTCDDAQLWFSPRLRSVGNLLQTHIKSTTCLH